MVAVLVLERDPLAPILTEALADEGHAVQACPSPAGLLAAAALCPGCMAVITPWGPGHAALGDEERGEIAHLAALVPTVLVSTRAWTERASADELGVAAVVLAPFELDAFCTTVRRVADRLPELRRHAAMVDARVKALGDDTLRALDRARERISRSREALGPPTAP
jgi:hypothetical protein